MLGHILWIRFYLHLFPFFRIQALTKFGSEFITLGIGSYSWGKCETGLKPLKII
jgi:hypothetical protein